MLVGIVRAFVGGFPFALLTGLPTAGKWNVGSLAMEMIEAKVLLLVQQLRCR